MKPLSTYERWMVKSNLQTAKETGMTPAEQAQLLRVNGYNRVADAVEAEMFNEEPPIEVYDEGDLNEVEQGRRERREFYRNRDY